MRLWYYSACATRESKLHPVTHFSLVAKLRQPEQRTAESYRRCAAAKPS